METLLLGAIALILGGNLLQQTRSNKRKDSVTPSPTFGVTPLDLSDVPYGNMFKRSADKYNVPIRLLVSTADYESSFNPKAINYESKADIAKGHNVDSIGIGQILYPDTAKALDKNCTVDKLLDPDYNIDLMGQLYKQLIKRYPRRENDGFFADAVSAYNAGSVRHNSEGEYSNQSYVDKVRSKWSKWRSL